MITSVSCSTCSTSPLHFRQNTSLGFSRQSSGGFDGRQGKATLNLVVKSEEKIGHNNRVGNAGAFQARGAQKRRSLHGCSGVPYTGCVPLGLEVLLRRLLHGCYGVPYTGCVPLGIEVLLTAFPTRVVCPSGLKCSYGVSYTGATAFPTRVHGVPYTGCVPLGLEVLLTAFPTRVLRRSLHGLCAPRA